MNDPFPRIHSPMLATLVDAPFDDDEWLFETKWDGFRALCTIAPGGDLRMISRNGKDFLGRFPELARLHASFRGTSVLVDAEIVALDRYQRSDFQRWQNAERRGTTFGYAPKQHAHIRWASPNLIAEVRFSEWTRDRRLRHPVFLGLREDKSAREVSFEMPLPRLG